MGMRFRKSFGGKGFRVNVSKSGIGYSVGGKGFRYTKKAGGGSRTTTSIPGTGISYVKDSKTGRTKKVATAGGLGKGAYKFMNILSKIVGIPLALLVAILFIGGEAALGVMLGIPTALMLFSGWRCKVVYKEMEELENE